MMDQLTTLPNRRQLDEVLSTTLINAERAGSPVCCAIIDVDHFERFNDDNGHDAGDAVLRAVGLALQGAVRDSSLVFRYGGEEFLLLLPGVGDAAATVRAEEIRSRIATLRVQYDGRELGPITVSIGLACAPADTEWQSLLQTADAALLRAEMAGRNQVITAAERRSA